ncbi:MAG: DUF5130 domain-containing protein [Actinomycetota bacterium]|nr:DUF5130 domain-containing protein [Actinomycetota bacterium]
MHLGARQRLAVKRAVAEAEEATGLQLCVYVGPAEGDSRARAEELFVAAGLDTRPAVLVLVAPSEHRVEVVTAPSVRSRLDDATCAAAVERMTGRFAAGDLAGGLVAGVRFLADAAGRGTGPPDAVELPDLLDG